MFNLRWPDINLLGQALKPSEGTMQILTPECTADWFDSAPEKPLAPKRTFRRVRQCNVLMLHVCGTPFLSANLKRKSFNFNALFSNCASHLQIRLQP